jgi:nuclear pore complex protein Nup155
LTSFGVKQIKSKYIEDFLNYTATLQQDSTQILDLLWHYYEKNKNYIAAAKILDQLAQRESTNSALKDRLEYISRAIVCAKSTGTLTKISGEGEFLHELEEKMEVARIQLSILDAVKDLPQTIHTSEAITILNSKLMDLSQLYEDFAEPFNLSHCKLAIIHCAGHYDPMLIESLWREIIEQGRKVV